MHIDMKKTLRWLVALVATPIVLFLLLALLLYLPPVQRWAVKQATQYASRSTGMDISIRQVGLSFPLDLELSGFRMLQKRDSLPQVKDTVADMRSLLCSVEFWPLFKGEVNIARLECQSLQLNTAHLIPSVRIKGQVGRLCLESRGIDLLNDTVRVNRGDLQEAFLDIQLSDTVPPDTTPSTSCWAINVSRLRLANTALTIHMPGDTLMVAAQFSQTEAKNVHLQPHDNDYSVETLDWQGGSLAYHQNFRKPTQGFDANHILLQQLHLGIDSFAYMPSQLQMHIRACNFLEHSGLRVTGLTGAFRMDSTSLSLPQFHLTMPGSDLSGRYEMALNAFADSCPGQISTRLSGYTCVADLQPFLSAVPTNLRRKLPSDRLNLALAFDGNMQQASIRQLQLSLPGKLSLSANGRVASLLQPDRLSANLHIKAKAHNLAFVQPFLPLSVRKTVHLPRNIGLSGNITANGPHYAADLVATEGGGTLYAKAYFNRQSMAYTLTAKAKQLHLEHFLPRQGLHPFTGTVATSGQGTDFLSPKTGIRFKANIDRFQYQSYALDHIRGEVSLRQGHIDAHLLSNNRMIGGNIRVSGRISNRLVDVVVNGHITRADLKTLAKLDKRWTLSTDANLHVRSNLKDYYAANGRLSAVDLREQYRHSTVQLLAGNFSVDGAMHGKAVNAHVAGLLANANLQELAGIDRAYRLSTTADVTLQGQLADKRYAVEGHVGDLKLTDDEADTDNPILAGGFQFAANMHKKLINGSLNGNVDHADFYQLGLVDAPMTTHFGADVRFSTNTNDCYDVDGMLSSLQVTDRQHTYNPGDIALRLLSRADTTHAMVKGGDFHLLAEAQGSYKRVLKAVNSIQTTLENQFKEKLIDQVALRQLLPVAHISLNSGRENFFSQLLQNNGYKFRNAQVDLTASPTSGINGTATVDSLVYKDSVTIDHANLVLTSNESQLHYDLAVENNQVNDYPYKGYLKGSFYERGLQTNATILDQKGKKALDMALQAQMKGNRIEMNILSKKSVMGYKEFTVNDGNYLYMDADQHVSAHMQLKADDGAGVQIYSNDEDSTSLQNVTLSMNNFELGKLFSVLPFMPKMSGVLNGDYHIVHTDNEVTVSSDMTIDNLVYEDCPMGNVGTNLVYMPKDDGTHYVDAIITKDGNDVGQLTGTYDSNAGGDLDAVFKLNEFPLNFVNGFVPDRLIGLQGTGEGELTVKGPLDNLDINGEVYLDSSYIYSDPYGVKMRFGNDPVTIQNSRLLFENFQVYANNDQPLNLYGWLNFRNVNKMSMSVLMQADNFELIDAEENPRSEVYGKAFVNFVGAMRGPLNKLKMGGRLEVLGNTDMTYVMRESALSTDDQMEQLVHFTNFNDSTADKVVVRPNIEGFQMDMSVSIDEQAHIVCALNSEHTNYIDLIGGGDLTLHYDPTNSMNLRGRYTLNSGQMKYSLDMIPLRTFNIQEGSYIEFTGDPMNPTLNITATENIKATYTGGMNDRIVNFTTGVKMTNNLARPGVEFIVEAPEDLDAQNNLNTMSAEEKAKIAVTLLASGMYLADGSGGTFAMNNALASFMQTKINDISGRALSSMGLDITANMESTADASGSLHTDYTLNFSKRLWNNRLRINMGGRVSTGSQLSEENGAYFDNFSLEYRLNKNETQYLKLYYEREAYDWLEGQLSEFGAGFMWRRKLQHFKDIFRFKPKKDNEPLLPNRPDTTLIRFKNEKK